MLDALVIGLGLCLGVWLFLGVLGWLTDIGQGPLTEQEARRRVLRSLERERRRESTAASRQ